MLKNTSYSSSCKHSRDRAQDAGTTPEQLITVRRRNGDSRGHENGRSIHGGRSTSRRDSTALEDASEIRKEPGVALAHHPAHERRHHSHEALRFHVDSPCDTAPLP